MSRSSQPNMPEAAASEDLVAYLDGELDQAGSRRVEELLRADPALRDEVQRLEMAWGLLDSLPRVEADEEFTQSTVEMVALHAADELEADRIQRPLRWRRRCWLAAGCLMVAGFLGVLAVDALWPGPDEELLRDLPVLQELDQFQQADDIDFLRRLREHNLFPDHHEN